MEDGMARPRLEPRQRKVRRTIACDAKLWDLVQVAADREGLAVREWIRRNLRDAAIESVLELRK